MGLKIVNLQAENFKRLVAVEIAPDGDLVIIAGENSQGKSSVMDSIWAALDYKNAVKELVNPIRDGQKQARIVINLGEIIVTRYWTSPENSYLKVTTKDGAQYPTPQTVLDALIGKLSFDPLEFSRLKPDAQKKQLAQLLNIDLDSIEIRRKTIYDQRTGVNSQMKSYKAILDKLPVPEVNLPDKEVSSKEVSDKLQKAYETKSQNDKTREGLEKLKDSARLISDNIDCLNKEIEELENKIKAKKEKIEEERKARETIFERIKKGEKIVKDLKDPDTEAIKKELSSVETINRQIRERNEFSKTENKYGDYKEESDRLTDELKKIDQEKEDILKAAKFPIPGLGFDDNGVTFNGQPLCQCSSSEKLKISLSIAMAMNPQLRVIRIMDGSLLDKDNMLIIKEMTQRDNPKENFQIWIERVGDEGETGVIIEDGKVKEIRKDDDIFDGLEKATKALETKKRKTKKS